MTTKLIIKNAATSNGDINVRVKTGGPLGHVVATTLTPGKGLAEWISTGHDISIDETWPTNTPANEQVKAGELADDLTGTECAIQDRMWGDANERADSTKNQLLGAAVAQLVLTERKLTGDTSEEATKLAQEFYPRDWNGFRDYGSTVANLVVAAAFIRSEIKRRILLGEDTTRTKRGEAYKGPDLPYVSADEAAKSLN